MKRRNEQTPRASTPVTLGRKAGTPGTGPRRWTRRGYRALLGPLALALLLSPLHLALTQASGGGGGGPRPAATATAHPHSGETPTSVPVTGSPTSATSVASTPPPATTTPRPTCVPQPAHSIYSLSLYPSIVRGGYAVTINVYMAGYAPCGGALVTLTSSDAAVAATPATLLIPAGSSWGVVTLRPPVRGTTASATITASSVTNSMVTSLTVTP